MGTPCTLDPLGSGNSSPYQKGEVLIEIAAPASYTSQQADVPQKGRYKVWIVGGKNDNYYCYYACNYSGSAAGYVGELYFAGRCRISIEVGALGQNSLVRIADIGSDDWKTIIQANCGNPATGAGGGGGGALTITQDERVTFVQPPEVSSNGNRGASSGSCCAASVYGGYGTQTTTGYGKLQYVGSK